MIGYVPGTIILSGLGHVIVVIAYEDECTYELNVTGVEWYTNTPHSLESEKIIYDPGAESV